MTGKYEIFIQNALIRYEFEIRRNITIIKGDSATGKTTLIGMISEYYEDGEASGITLKCDKTCSVLAGRDWKAVLETWKDRIVFIDEGNDFILTDEFASFIQNTDNYYVIVTREGLPNLPYSVEEIYGIRESGKYAFLKQKYNELYHIYGGNYVKPVVPEVILVEDSNAGYEFYKNIPAEKREVLSANGKSNIFQKIQSLKGKHVLIIADGAAFGAEMDRVIKEVYRETDMALYLPESFEWILLKAGIVESSGLKDILDTPENYIESKEYFSWERFFTSLLIEETQNTYLKYSKKKLNPAYLNKHIIQKICAVMEGISLY